MLEFPSFSTALDDGQASFPEFLLVKLSAGLHLGRRSRKLRISLCAVGSGVVCRLWDSEG